MCTTIHDRFFDLIYCESPQQNGCINSRFITGKNKKKSNLHAVKHDQSNELVSKSKSQSKEENNSSRNFLVPERAVVFVTEKYGCISRIFKLLRFSVPPLKHNGEETPDSCLRSGCEIHGKNPEEIFDGNSSKSYHARQKRTNHPDGTHFSPMEDQGQTSQQSKINVDFDPVLEKDSVKPIFHAVSTRLDHLHRCDSAIQYCNILDTESSRINARTTRGKCRYNHTSSPEESIGLIVSSLSSISCPSFSDDSAFSFDSYQGLDNNIYETCDEMLDDVRSINSVDSLLSYSESVFDENISTSSSILSGHQEDNRTDQSGYTDKNSQEEIIAMLNNLSEECNESTNSFVTAEFYVPTYNKL